ncbi:MAG: PstC family ABC transporter permease [Kiritimatiellia bacterium]|nr:phosphate ABC transporter permease subunit PstC [Lentisphaerota bacterium]
MSDIQTSHYNTGDLVLSRRASIRKQVAAILGQGLLFSITSVAALAVLFIFYFIARDAWPFFHSRGIVEFFTETAWYPTRDPSRFGALAIFVGSGLVTLGAALVAAPLGIAAAVCLSDVLPFSLRQIIKPVIEILAAIPSVAYGFFALVVFAPLLQNSGSRVLSIAWWALATPTLGIIVLAGGDILAEKFASGKHFRSARILLTGIMALTSIWLLVLVGRVLGGITITTGTNALNVSILLGIMALPTVVSVSEDALQAAGRELREGSYALGATRAETICRTILPAAGSGIFAAVLLGVMRALGETMVVWMASGNAAQIPTPWFNFLQPVRTLTATIAGDMGEADHVTGSDRYHVLFAMGLCLLAFCFVCNLAAEWVVARQRRKLGGE